MISRSPKHFLDRSSIKPSGDAPSHGQDGLTNSPHVCTTKPVWKESIVYLYFILKAMINGSWNSWILAASKKVLITDFVGGDFCSNT